MRSVIAMIGLALVAFFVAGLVPRTAAQAQHEAQSVATCTLQVEKMTCAGCAAAVKMAAKKIDGVKDATVSYEKKTADVTYDPGKTNPETIAKAITEKSGFPTRVPKKSGK